MTTGRQTLEEIEAAIGKLGRREDELGWGLAAATSARADRLRDRAALVRRFAEVRVRSALSDGVVDEADRLESDVALILAGRQRTIASVAARKADADERHAGLLAESTAALVAIADLEDRLDDLAGEARASLASDPVYVAAVGRRDELSGHREKAAQKLDQARLDRARKGAVFEADPLFMYLWRRSYRQGASYAPHPLIRWLDDWVAGLVRYNEARANYTLLTEIPERLGQHLERLEADLAAVTAQVEAIEAQRIAHTDAGDLTGQLRAARGRQRDIDAQLAAVEAEVKAAAGDLNRYAQGADDSYRQTIETLAGFLDRERYERLVNEARASSEPEDDELAVKIGAIDREIGTLDAEAREKSAELDKLSRRRDDLVKVAADFRRKSYHQPGSVFEPDFDLDDLLGEVVKGVLTAAEYYARTRARQHWKSRPADAFRRKSGFPPFDFDIGSLGRGGRGRGGGGGGDFKTGGGF
ncbi:MAG: hypothetical protein NW217_10790 [Hyphomicrobiaceae bacterium]|nr:hypothetical protein [Hyphomicrobiaceae bacterium]